MQKKVTSKGGTTEAALSILASNKGFVGKSGKIAGVDIKEMAFIEDCYFLNKSIEDLQQNDFDEIKEFLPFDLVLSDMAPNISGIREKDDAQIIYLVNNVLSVIDNFLTENGSTLIKVFQGESLDYTRSALNERFRQVKISKPKASRSNSNEIYIVGKELK